MNNKIEVFVDDYDHQQKIHSDFKFTDYRQVILNHLIFYFYQLYFSTSNKINLDRLTDSTPRVLVIGQKIDDMDVDVKNCPYVDLVRDNLKDAPTYEQIINNLEKYGLIILTQQYSRYGSSGLCQRIETYLSKNIETDLVKNIKLVSLKSIGNRSSIFYNMFKERYSLKHLTSIGSNKSTPHLGLKSKSGDTFFIPYGPFPETYDWVNYGLK